MKSITSSISLKKLIRQKNGLPGSERASFRLIKSTAFLPEGEYAGWQMIVPKSGIVKMTAFGTDGITESDLRWIFEKEAVTASGSDMALPNELTMLYELILPVTKHSH